MPNNNAIESMDEEDDTFNCGMTCDELKEFVFAHLDTADYTVRLKKDLHELNVRLDQVTDKAKETDDLFSSCYALLQKRKEGCGATTNCSVKSAEIVLSDEEDDLVIVDDPESNMQQTKLRRSASADRVGSLLHEQSASHASLQQQIPKRSLTVLNLQKQKPIDLAIGMKLYAKKSNYVWYKGTLVDIVNPQRPISERLYKVKFDGKGLRTLGPKLIASTEPPSEPVPVGTRILALYNDDNNSGSFYAGIVAESPSIRNNNRYLVFFDDGYAQYSFANHIRKVYEQSQQVWEDVDPDSQEFIHSYLKQYPERPMVRLNVGQVVKTEWKGQWYPAHVRKVDASLVQMYFEADRRVEWIYRGSTRLEPLFTELANAEAVKLSSGGKGRRRCTMVAKTNHSRPVVEYTRNVDDTSDSGDVKKQSTARKTTTITTAPCSKPQTSDLLQAQAAALVERIDLTSDEGGDAQRYRENGAIGLRSKSQRSLSSSDFKKSSGAKLNATACTNRESDGTIIILDYPDMSMWPDRPKQFVKHTCGPQCLFGDDNPANYKGHNPLFIPIDCGWQRQTARHSKSVARKSVFYVAPCKRRFRNESEVDKFLVITNSRLTIDMFCFEPDIRVDTEFVSTRVCIVDSYKLKRNVCCINEQPVAVVNVLRQVDCNFCRSVVVNLQFDEDLVVDSRIIAMTFCDIKDLSYCKESVPISCVNGMTHEYPDFVEYSNQRIPANGVNLNLDPEFLCGCDCTDGCRDPTRCQCIQLTLEQSKAWPSSLLPPTLHYVNRRLIENISTGIFECNSRCKCDSRCHNRVVQNGLSLKLQVFKTEKRGWGLRCLHDIPAGCFICIYAGQLLNDEGANEDGKQFGDEYLAELDLIEVVEHTKEDYESDVEEPDSLVTSKTHRRSTIDYSEHSSDNEGKHEDSDRMHQKGNKKTGNNVKSCGQTSRKSTKNDGKKARTAAWVNDSASVSITISDDEDSVPTGCAVDTTDLRTVGEPSCAIESSAATDHIIEAVNTTGLSSACGNATTDASFLAITDATDVIASRSEHDPNDKVDAATSTIAPPSENDIKIEATAVTSMTKDEPVASKTDEDTTTNESITTMLDEEKGTSSVATEVSAERTETDKMHLHVAFGEIAGDKVDDGVDSSIVTCERKAESTNFGDVVTNSVCHGHVFIENISCSDVPTAVDDRVIETVDSIATVGLIDTVKIEDIVDQCAVASDPVEEGGLSSVDNKQKDIEGNHDDSGAVNGHYQQSITDSNLDQHITSGENDQHNFEADTSDSVEKSGAVDRCGKLEADHNGKETEILITELTSLNTDNIDPDSDDERPSNIEASVETLSDEQQTCKRLTRSTIPMSRFHNLPDPKSQQSINKPTSKSATGKQHQRTDSDKKEEKIGTRELFGDELCYIMDAKSVGNLGRYLNHSCDPNVFVQNVFVDTHDLRFPWVAFFSSQHITAGTELTWDYQYEVGSVKDKMLYCYCGSSNCRGRLL